MTLKAGETATLTVSVQPASADQSVTAAPADPNIAAATVTLP
ncbi:hypothetical protein BSD967_03165 [Bifidobacterium saguini]|uniref:Uncharacterized protein n=1 Tax=Bifidobacterium saguini TaxID=762210 RepID=A0ABX7SG32_9BIFI|nr:hypothetical protein BSD967_03165 [Bifidobacterium saguini]